MINLDIVTAGLSSDLSGHYRRSGHPALPPLLLPPLLGRFSIPLHLLLKHIYISGAPDHDFLSTGSDHGVQHEQK